MEAPDYLPISMLNQVTYCERRFWLMYVCGEMEVNAAVLEGTQQHARAHAPGAEREGDKVVHRRVYLWSDRLRVSGMADLVEERGDGSLHTQRTHEAGDPLPPWFDDPPGADPPPPRVLVPVEYKRGRQGKWMNDRIQLCAQALCLEERTGQPVEQGEIFYWRSRRRVQVPFTPELRAQTEAAVARAFALLAEGRIPAPIEQRARCHDCSLEEICLPRELSILASREI